ncbi:MAG: hypothetical protein JSU87_16225 [Gemmatimonadota bacterium]|nr:MAG: hypothetical protein JSU87_16225 [Gemmatimonadota bacterium]
MSYVRHMLHTNQRGRRRLRLACLSTLVSIALLAISGDALGQTRSAGAESEGDSDPTRFYSSAYLPLDHWAYRYVDVLVARGALEGLSPFVQPYRRLDIAAAILRAEDRAELSEVEREWLLAVKDELRQEIELLTGAATQDVEFKGQFAVGLKGLSHTHRDPLRPEGDEKLFPTLDLQLRGEAPMVTGALRMRWDNHYLNDPQFPEGRAIESRQCDPVIAECGYRVEDGYVEVQLPYVRVFFGRMDRNWGLPGRDGLLISPYAYSYDHIGYRFGNERLALTGLYAPFNDFGGDTARHFASHRFDWRILDNLQVSVGESVVYGGENRRIDFNLTNPVGVWEISGSSEGRERNALGMAEVWWRPRSDLVTYGAFMVDNTSVGDEGAGKASGFNQYAAALGVQLPAFQRNLALRGDFTLVNSLAYRSRVDFWEYYTLDEIGLAQDKTDVIVVSLRGDWFPAPNWILVPGLDLMWKGEDDIRLPFPEDAFRGHDLLLVGVIEKTVRASLGGRWHHRRGDVRWDVGLNIVKNDAHIERDWRLIGAARVQAEIRQVF